MNKYLTVAVNKKVPKNRSLFKQRYAFVKAFVSIVKRYECHFTYLITMYR